MVISVRTISPKRMVLDFRPVSVWAYRAFGLLFLACATAITLFFPAAVSFSCSRLTAMCTYHRSATLGRQDQAFPVMDLRGGTVETRTNLLIGSMTLVVMHRTGDLAIPLATADGPTKDTMAVELSRFALDPTANEFQIHEDTRLGGYFFGAFLLGAGLVCLFAVERVRLILDRGLGTLQLRSRRFFKSSQKTVRLVHVKDVRMREHRFRNTASWSVAIVMDDGAELPLTRMPLFTIISAEQTEHLVRRWLA